MEVPSGALFGGISLFPRGGSVGDVQIRVQRQGGRWACRVALGLLGAALATASVAFGAAGTSRALAGEPGKEPLPGHQSRVPPGATLIGPAPAATTLPLVVTLLPRDPAALAAEVRAVSDPHSPEYRHFVTPSEFAQRFGATPGTIAHVTAALRHEGLTVGAPSSIGLSLPVSGTVAQIQSAFSTPIDRYHLASGKTGYDNRSAPQVPVTVAPQIQGILGLNTLSPPKPSTTVPQASPAGPHGGSFSSSPAPALGQPSPGVGCAANIVTEQKGGALDAEQLAQAYSFDPLYSANHYGAGTTVALLEMSTAGYLLSDIQTFATCYGISLPLPITQTDIDGGGAVGGATAEAELDIENVLSLAPKANIEVYEGGPTDSIYDVFNRIVTDDTAKIVSASWTNGCEAYQTPSYMASENTLFQAAAAEGQSIFAATGDQGSQGCNLNGVVAATTGNNPVAQAVDPSTGTLYIANKSNNSVSVDSEGGTNASNAGTKTSVSTGTGPDAVALDPSDHRVFVANAGSTLTEFSSTTCNQTAPGGCGSPTLITSAGHLSSPDALAVNGSTLYVGNSSNGTVAVYDASANTWKATVSLLASSVPSALAVDSANGFVYVADRSNGRIEYFNAATCNATTQTGCSATPTAVSVGNTPVALTVAGSAGDLYVANAGSGGGVSVVSLSSHALVTTIPTSQPFNGTGLVQSIGMSPDNHEVLAVLVGLGFPGDVMATINTSTQSISSTVGLENGSDTMGQLVSDGTLGYTWVTDETSTGDIVQNLNLAVSDPAGQPYVTAVGGTSVTGLGPPPTEKVWNDALNYSEGAAGGGISQSFAMPAYQQPLGTVSGSTGTPCGNSSGNCREIPDVSADADPSTGYIVYDTHDFGNSPNNHWGTLGGTSGAAPLWAAALAVVASANGNTVGYGALNPALYLLAQKSPSTYLNDITSGNNDYNATNGGEFPAMSGYDMASGLGTPVVSQLASGLMGVPLAVAVSGSQTYGGSPTFSGSANYAGSGGPPFDVTVNTSGITCTTVGASTSISPTLTVGSYTLASTSCTGATLSGPNQGDYTIVYTSAANDFTVNGVPVNVAVSGSQVYGGSASFAGADSPPSGITVSTSGLSCSKVGAATTIAPTLAAGNYTLLPSSCGGATLSGANAANYAVAYTSAANDFTVTPAPLTVTASSGSMTYGGTVPTITPGYSGFKNSDNSSSLTSPPTCSTTATSSSPVAGSPYVSSCGGAVDPNYTFSYNGGTVTVSPAPLTITASSAPMTFGGTVPTITPGYSGFKNSDNSSSLSTPPTCSTTATSSSPASPPTYPSSCSGAVDSNYSISYVAGAVSVNKALLTITASSGSMTYGGTVPTITPAYSGFVNGDSASSLTTPPTCSTTATSSSPVAGSPYVSSCSGAVDSNYTISYGAGSVTVTKAPLTITASNVSMNYGGSVPTVVAGYAGFVNGEGPANLTTPPTCATTATNSSPASPPTYPSTCSGAVDPNYAIGYAAGTVTVNKVPLTITASSPHVSYGSTPTVTAGYSGFVNGDTAASLSTPPTCADDGHEREPGLPADLPVDVQRDRRLQLHHQLRPGRGDRDARPFDDHSLQRAHDLRRDRADDHTGLLRIQERRHRSSLTTPPTCSTTATSSSPASPPTYPSSCSGATDPNYTINYVAGAVTVNKVPLTITASSGSMNYGGTTPTITPAYSGFVNGDSAATLTTPATCSTTATSSSPASPPTYPTSCGGAVDSNYAFSYVAGSVTVSPVALTITASSPAIAYGSVPTITPLYSGFVNGDSGSSLSPAPTCSTTATSSSPVSPPTYPSSCGGAADPNYAISYVPGVVTVTKAQLTITASSGSMTYGGTPPTVTAALLGLEERRWPGVAERATDLLDNGHRRQPGLAADVPVVVQRCRRPQLHLPLRGRQRDGEQGPADDHGLERVHDLRRDATDHHPRILGFRQQRHRLVADHPADLYADGDQLEPGLAADLPVDVQRGSRPQLRLQLPVGHRDREQGPADDHRLERVHDLRRDATDHHAGLLGLRQRRLRLRPHDATPRVRRRRPARARPRRRPTRRRATEQSTPTTPSAMSVDRSRSTRPR